jgi:hypothetical protein
MARSFAAARLVPLMAKASTYLPREWTNLGPFADQHIQRASAGFTACGGARYLEESSSKI